MKTRAHVFVSGRVQGVFFRSEVSHEARRHDVGGWVRNLSDGRVEVVLEGEEENVKRLVKFCRRGPIGAEVTGTSVGWESYSGKLKDFEIRY